jgi:hypothetical protein
MAYVEVPITVRAGLNLSIERQRMAGGVGEDEDARKRHPRALRAAGSGLIA